MLRSDFISYILYLSGIMEVIQLCGGIDTSQECIICQPVFIHRFPCVSLIVYSHGQKNGTLGKYDQRRLWKLIRICNTFDLLLKKFTNT